MFNHNLISRLAPAKINFALHVTDQREDGYHCLDMIVAFAQYGDHVVVGLASEDSFTISGRYSSKIPISADNLVVKARDLLPSCSWHWRRLCGCGSGYHCTQPALANKSGC